MANNHKLLFDDDDPSLGSVGTDYKENDFQHQKLTKIRQKRFFWQRWWKYHQHLPGLNYNASRWSRWRRSTTVAKI